MASKEQLEGMEKEFAIAPVEIPGRGKVFVREIDGERDTDLFNRNWVPVDGQPGKLKLAQGFEVRWIAAALCDEAGVYFYSPADEAKIKKWPRRIIQRLYGEVSKVNQTEADAVEEAAKN